MGTRSTVKFYQEKWRDDSKEVVLLSVYHQFDGYLSGVGQELADFLKSKTIINGIGTGQDIEGGYANGMGCLAAQYVKEHKDRTGGLYITTPDDSQDYNYEVRVNNGKLIMSVPDCNIVCTPEEFTECAKRYNNEGEEE